MSSRNSATFSNHLKSATYMRGFTVCMYVCGQGGGPATGVHACLFQSHSLSSACADLVLFESTALVVWRRSGFPRRLCILSEAQVKPSQKKRSHSKHKKRSRSSSSSDSSSSSSSSSTSSSSSSSSCSSSDSSPGERTICSAQLVDEKVFTRRRKLAKVRWQGQDCCHCFGFYLQKERSGREKSRDMVTRSTRWDTLTFLNKSCSFCSQTWVVLLCPNDFV